MIVDPVSRRMYSGVLHVENGHIAAITELDTGNGTDGFLMPGFVDAHVHIESSMLVPSQFARLAVRHGTVATVSDPHEIANVLGLEGVEYMLRDAATVPLVVAFGAPSCVPATAFETAGAVLGPEDVARMLADPRIGYLSEMMNYPGVVHEDPDVMAKIRAAHDAGKPVDGHCPMLSGPDLEKYVRAGITTDHECTSEGEAREKLALGMRIAIREGSAARNFEALIAILDDHPGRVMFCSDDKHPDDLVLGHIDRLAARAIAHGCDLWNVLDAACVTPVRHYGLDIGLLKVGDRADFIRVRDLEQFEVQETVIGGARVAEDGRELFTTRPAEPLNRFVRPVVAAGDFAVPAEGRRIRVIEAVDGAIVTGGLIRETRVEGRLAVTDPVNDLLKLAVVNRYLPAPPSVGFVQGVGLRRGAIASSVAHDSHNIIAVGTGDADLKAVVDAVSEAAGGIAVFDGERSHVLALPVAGLMSTQDGETVAAAYQELDRLAKSLGSRLGAPFMTLSFLALLVIPSLKLGDQGLFDVEAFGFTDLFLD